MTASTNKNGGFAGRRLENTMRPGQEHSAHYPGYDADAQEVAYTVFADKYAETKQEVSESWSALIKRLGDPATYPTKEACPLIKGATFDGRRNFSNCLREDDFMVSVSFIEGDYDAELVSIDEGAKRLRDAGIEAFLHTSGRHTDATPRWRVLAPLSAPCTPAEREAHVATLNGALGGILAGESFTQSQSYYFGRVKGVKYETRHVRGQPVDLDLFIESIFTKNPTPAKIRHDGEVLELPSPVSDGTMQDITSAAWALKPERFATKAHELYLPVFMAFKHLAFCGREVEAEALLRGILDTHGSDHKRQEFAQKWRTETGAVRGHYRVIFTLAETDGWNNPRKSPTVQTVIERLRKLPRDEVLATWAQCAARLPKDQAADVLEEAERLLGIGKRPLNAALTDARSELSHERKLAHAGARKVEVYRPHDSVEQARGIGKLILKNSPMGALVNYAGRPSRIVEARLPHAHQIDDGDAPPPATMLIEGHTPASMRAEVEGVAIFYVQRVKDLIEIAVPPLTIEALLELDAAESPAVSGLLSHPIVRADGSIVTENGLDASSGLFAHGLDDTGDLRAYSKLEAEEAFKRLQRDALAGFEFASGLNRDIALAGFFTAVQRRLMDTAPGLAILAPSQSSGKTTLARRIHLVLTGRDMPVVNLPIGDDAEIEKRLLALLLTSPPMITFDNVGDGLVVHGGPLNAAMTSPSFEGRMLGSTKMLRAPTSAFFVITGNNLRLGTDEVTRWLTTTLAPPHARPEERKFKNGDVVSHALRIRDQVLRDIVGIVAGFMNSGDVLTLRMGTRFNRWDRMVRQPLMWAGGQDVAESFAINSTEADHTQALRSLLLVLHAEFDGHRFTAREIVRLASSYDTEKSDRLTDALEALCVRNVNSTKSVGKALQGCLDRAVDVDDSTLRLQKQIDRDGVSSFVVRKCGVCGV